MREVRDDDTALLRLLDDAGRSRIDTAIRERGYIAGVIAVREAFRPWGGLHLYDARDMVLKRFAELGVDPCPPEPVPTMPDLVERIAGRQGVLRELVISWDGDDFGWMVRLDARFASGEEALVVCLRCRAPGPVGWAEPREVRAFGAALAERFRVPLRTDHEDAPYGISEAD
ncbi:hypothetical protein [Nocardiopsis sp. CC223A]|uniref:hypothetical protein n=1 Tax=Nocardiopsis sp. CC223A TaxID=3044051 RepID=UPI00278C7905|nr:hypothetical protein [Nocardiopsis sp. CC223A]